MYLRYATERYHKVIGITGSMSYKQGLENETNGLSIVDDGSEPITARCNLIDVHNAGERKKIGGLGSFRYATTLADSELVVFCGALS
jgi:hypothetical protein